MSPSALRILGVTLATVVGLAAPAWSEPLLEEVVQAGPYLFYRDSVQRHGYYYVPPQPRLARGASGQPEFLFVKYTRAGAAATPQTRGGLVHFLVTWGFTAEEQRQAQQALQREDGSGRILGPLPFKKGRFAVVSASAGEDGIFTNRIVGEGQAPILPGTKAAASIALSPEGATVLWDSFQRETSEVSVVFALTFSGLTPAYKARLLVNWDQVYKHHDVAADFEGQIYAVKVEAEIRATFDKLRSTGAIKLEVEGESASMDKILNIAYGHITKQMFEPVLQGLDGSPPLTPRTPTDALKKKLGFLPPGLVPAIWTGTGMPLRTVQDDPPELPSFLPAFLRDPIEEPYVPPSKAELDSGVAVGSKYADSVLASAYRHEDNRSEFVQAALAYRRLYERGHGEQNHIEGVSEWAWQVAKADTAIAGLMPGFFGRIFERKAELWTFVFAAHLHAQGYIPDGYEGPIEHVRTTINGGGPALPVTKMLAREWVDETLATWGKGLYAARSHYFAGELAETVTQADVAIGAIPYLSEPYLWKARALDRLDRVNEAIEAYRAYVDRRRDGEGDAANEAVEARLSALAAKAVTVAKADEPAEGAKAGADASPKPDAPKKDSEKKDSEKKEAAKKDDPGPSKQATTKKTEAKPSESKPKDGKPAKGEAGKGGKGPDPSPYKVRVGYQYRRVKKSGRYEVDMRQRLREEREIPIAGNIGGFVRGNASRYLLEVDLDDPSFQDRTVEVLLDGQNTEDFQRYVNAVSVKLRRVHKSGRASEDAVVFTRKDFAAEGNRKRWVYPRMSDPVGRWFDYAYKVRWDFHGGASWEAPAWEATDRDVITLAPPAARREVAVNLKAADFVAHDVEAVEVEFENQLFGRTRRGSLVMTLGEPLSETYTMVTGADDGAYRYRAKWIHQSGTETVTPWQDRTSSYLLVRHP